MHACLDPSSLKQKENEFLSKKCNKGSNATNKSDPRSKARTGNDMLQFSIWSKQKKKLFTPYVGWKGNMS